MSLSGQILDFYDFIHIYNKGENLRHVHLCFKKNNNLGPGDKIRYIWGLKSPFFW